MNDNNPPSMANRVRRLHEPQDETLKALDRLVTWVELAYHQLPEYAKEAWRIEYVKAESTLKKGMVAEYNMLEERERMRKAAEEAAEAEASSSEEE